MCPNRPPCPHVAAVHDVEDLEDTTPRCCITGCTCGVREPQPVASPAGILAGAKVRARYHLDNGDGPAAVRSFMRDTSVLLSIDSAAYLVGLGDIGRANNLDQLRVAIEAITLPTDRFITEPQPVARFETERWSDPT